MYVCVLITSHITLWRTIVENTSLRNGSLIGPMLKSIILIGRICLWPSSRSRWPRVSQTNHSLYDNSMDVTNIFGWASKRASNTSAHTLIYNVPWFHSILLNKCLFTQYKFNNAWNICLVTFSSHKEISALFTAGATWSRTHVLATSWLRI